MHFPCTVAGPCENWMLNYMGMCKYIEPLALTLSPQVPLGATTEETENHQQLNTHTPYVCGFARSDVVHGCIVYTERAKTAADSCGTSHASAVSTPLRWIFKNAL